MGTLTFQAAAGGSLNLNGPNIAGTVNLTLPTADGTNGQPLQTNGSGTLSFATLSTTAGGTGLTSFTSTGIPYASSTSALTTGSALTFDGTNLATTGTATATKLIPTGTSVTGNGIYLPTTNAVAISTAGVEAARFDASQNLNIGTATTVSGAKLNVSNGTQKFQFGTGVGPGGSFAGNIDLGGSNGFASNVTSTSGIAHYQFYNPNGAVGSIVTNASTTTYNTSSDQRLKENIQDAESASSLIDSLQVRQFDWKTDSTHQRYGFVAQELLTVAPEAVYQPTNIEEMMAVDYSKLVPMLVKEIQNLRIRIATLENI